MDRWSRSLTELNDDEHEFTDIPLNIDQEIGTPNLGSPKSTGRVTIGNQEKNLYETQDRPKKNKTCILLDFDGTILSSNILT